MIVVEKISEGIRKEGVNYGLPMVFVQLGEGIPYNSAGDLAKEILLKTKCQWICILGINATQIGMGTFFKCLSAVGFETEVECSGLVRDPAYLHSVTRWVVDYVPDALFKYTALRPSDMVRFTISGEGDLDLARMGFEQLRTCSCSKYINLNKVSASMERSVFELARKYERTRIYKC